MDLTAAVTYPALISRILNIINSTVLVFDSAQSMSFANSRAAFMLRATLAELKGTPLRELFMPDDREIFLGNILQLTRERQEYETEAMLLRRDGSSFLAQVFSFRLTWDGEECLVVTVHDISQMKELERTLRYTERIAFLGCMLDDISHQIRNPVQIIGGLARRIGDNHHYEEKHLATILEQAGRLEALLDTLNDFIKLPRPRLEKVSLEALLGQLEERLAPVAARAGGRLQLVCGDGLGEDTVFIDPELLGIAVEAAVVNACEAYPADWPDKVVEMRLFRTEEAEWPYALKVVDRGSGIRRQDLPKVFGHFFSRKTRHLGMGLTLARRILEEQDGDVAVESAEGLGTNVIFYLVKERRRAIRVSRL